MPLTSKGNKILANMVKQYGKKRGQEVFYASENKGTIKGVHKKAKESFEGKTTEPLKFPKDELPKGTSDTAAPETKEPGEDKKPEDAKTPKEAYWLGFEKMCMQHGVSVAALKGSLNG